jgi:hypothetical protein
MLQANSKEGRIMLEITGAIVFTKESEKPQACENQQPPVREAAKCKTSGGHHKRTQVTRKKFEENWDNWKASLGSSETK